MYYPAFLAFAKPALGQTNTYVPFPTSNAEWNEDQLLQWVEPGDNSGYDDAGYYYRISHDSIINSQTYHLINFAWRWYTSGSKDGLSGTSTYDASNAKSDSIGTLIGAMREDSLRRIYYRDFGNPIRQWCQYTSFPKDSDLLIYDFNLKPGDTTDISMYQSNRVEVFHYDSVLVNSTYRRSLLLWVVTPNGVSTVEWCEGIGDIQLGLLGTRSIPNPPAGICSTRFDCYLIYNQVIYNTGNGSCDTVVPTGINTPLSQKSSLQFFPNPASDELFLKFSQNFIPKEISIYNAIGQQIYLPFTLNTNASLDVKNLPAGLYFIKATDNENVLTDMFIKE